MAKIKLPVAYSDIEAAAECIKDVANKTPVFTSRTVNARVNSSVYFKCENFQRTGSFKFRGAYNAMSRLSEENRQKGIITSSSGNHAQAVALAGRLLGIKTTIVMPVNAPEVKKAATREYGAEILYHDQTNLSLQERAAEESEARGLPNIHPFDHLDVIAGQGTIAKEFFEQVGSLDLLLAACGGGGHLAGSALAAKSLSSDCRVIGVEPESGDDATRSFYSKQLQRVENPDTIADGARLSQIGELTFPLILRNVDEMVTVSESQILQAMFFLWGRMKLVVEPTGALAFAALLAKVVQAPDAQIGVIISGGNVDLKRLVDLIAKG